MSELWFTLWINDTTTQETSELYTKLYRSEGADEAKIEEISNKTRAKLSKDQSRQLNKFISEEEMIKALKAMKNNKSPGEDGITKEFYITFLEDIKDELCEMFNNIIFKKEMRQSLRNAIITLL